jgi:hypothetical protein
MTKNEEIFNLINPPNNLNSQDFIEGLGSAVVGFFHSNNKLGYLNTSLEFHCMRVEILSNEQALNIIDVHPINVTLQELDTGWLKESPADILGKHSGILWQVAEQATNLFGKSIPLSLTRFVNNHFSPKFPSSKIQFEIKKTLENNHWL